MILDIREYQPLEPVLMKAAHRLSYLFLILLSIKRALTVTNNNVIIIKKHDKILLFFRDKQFLMFGQVLLGPFYIVKHLVALFEIFNSYLNLIKSGG